MFASLRRCVPCCTTTPYFVAAATAIQRLPTKRETSGGKWRSSSEHLPLRCSEPKNHHEQKQPHEALHRNGIPLHQATAVQAPILSIDWV